VTDTEPLTPAERYEAAVDYDDYLGWLAARSETGIGGPESQPEHANDENERTEDDDS